MRFAVEVAGLPLAFECADSAFVAAARRRYRAFLAPTGAPYSVEVVDRLPEPKLGVLPIVEKAGARRRDFVLRGRRLVVHRAPHSLDSFLRLIVSLRLKDGVLVHAASAGGIILPGPSGAGKSTFGAKIGARAILSDELTALVRRDGWRAWGTPFWGSFAPGRSNRSAPLEAIVFLDRRAARGLRPITAAEALVRLLECVLCFRNDEATAKRLLALCADAVRSAPSFRLSYDAKTTSRAELQTLLRRATGASLPAASEPSK